MTFGMSQFLGVFFEESEEHLAALEHLLLTLDVASPDPEALNGIFRAAHSIKGSSGMFGFDDLTSVTHVLETLLDKIRSGEVALRADMIDVFLETRDVLTQLLDAHRSETPNPAIPIQQSIDRLNTLISREQPAAANTDNQSDDSFGFFDDAPGCPLADSESQQSESISFADESWGLFDVHEDNSEAASAQSSAPQTDGNTDYAESATPYGIYPEAPGAPSDMKAYGLFPQAPGAPSDINEPGVLTAAETPNKPLTESRAVSDKATESAPHPLRRASDSETNSIRVNVEKIDSLINQVGELVITQAMLAQLTSELDTATHERIFQALNQLQQNSRELQESVMSIRMLPISFVFNRFPRLVRDTCSKLGKQVELILVGENTELDKGMIEKLTDPLTHIVRNSIDHGIESPAERVAAGKTAQGTVRMAAFHQGGRIVVEISDDGKGLARDKILAKAREKGMTVTDEMPDSEVWQLIFMPGFSTAEAVTDLSGRGVGMDVVRRNILAIGGRIDIESVAGMGTRISIRLPLTLAILDGMVIDVGKTNYIVPLTNIVESLQLRDEHIYSMTGDSAKVISVRNEYLPLLSLHQLMKLDTAPPPLVGSLVLILEAEGKTFALQVDELLGQQQVVIKSLEQNFRRVDGISGATIMGDGSVALILDIDALPRLAGEGVSTHA